MRDCVSVNEYNKLVDRFNYIEKSRLETERLLLVIEKLNPNVVNTAIKLINKYGTLNVLKQIGGKK